MKETIKKGVGTLLAVAVVALIGVGQVQAQPFNSDQATVNASINVLEQIEISAGNNGVLDFGNALPGDEDVSATPVDLTVTGGSNASFTISWDGPTLFNPSSGTDFGWTETVLNGTSEVTNNDELSLGSNGSQTLTLEGNVSEVPTDVANENLSNSSITFTVSYTSL